uniref:Ubiquitin carboxyl-terminal hydrolase n=1 Tax=Schistosoma curassoni TaxID=6186 RepID=A0A183JH62_9TREM
MTDNCKHVLKVKTSIQLGILSPEHWHCSSCHTTESVWACLSCSNFACGRYISEHALQHFRQTNHPLCIDVNEKFVYCYICDDFVLNDNAPGDIKLLRMALDAVTTQDFGQLLKQKRGRRILRFRGKNAEKNGLRLLKADDIQAAVVRNRISCLSWALHLWWSRYAESRLNTVNPKKKTKSRKIPLTLTPAFTGLRNLGNTCYMNSILQILRHTAPFANYIMNHTLSEINSHSRKRRSHLDDLSIADPVCPVKRQAITSLFSKNQVIISHSYENLWSSLPTETPSCSPNTENSFGPSCEPNLVSVKKNIIPKCKSFGGLNGGQCQKFMYDCYQQSPSSSLVNPQVSSIPSLYDEMHNLFKLLWSGQRSIVSPSNLLSVVWATLPTFKGYKQQDAQEFLSLLLDRLQAELHSVPMSVSVSGCDFITRAFRGYSVSHIQCSTCHVTACTEEPIYELSLSLPTKCHSDESCTFDIVDLLRQFVSPSPIDGASYACVKCNQCSEINKEETDFTEPALNQCSYDSNDHLGNLSYPVSTSCELTETFSLSESPLSATSSVTGFEEQYTNPPIERSLQITQPSVVQSGLEEQYTNPPIERSFKITQPSVVQSAIINSPKNSPTPLPKNSLLTHATQTIRLSKLPRVLRLHIKRFRWVGRQREKLTCHVSFPLILNMSEFVCHQSSIFTLPKEFEKSSLKYLYHLTGVVVHHGRGFQSGHYTSYCLNDKVLVALQANVSLCDFSEVASAQAYILFYSELMPRTPFPNWYKDSIASVSPYSTTSCSVSEPESLKNQSYSPSCSNNHESTCKNYQDNSVLQEKESKTYSTRS